MELIRDFKLSELTAIPIWIWFMNEEKSVVDSCREENHNVLLMMMRAFPPSAGTASDATTTSGFGRGLGSGSHP